MVQPLDSWFLSWLAGEPPMKPNGFAVLTCSAESTSRVLRELDMRDFNSHDEASTGMVRVENGMIGMVVDMASWVSL